MPSIDDVFNELKQVNTSLQVVHADLTKIDNDVTSGITGILQNLQNIVTVEYFAAKALAHLSKQDDTVICILEKISKQTCATLNEAHVQTGYECSIKESAKILLDLYKSSHPDAALEFERLERLHQQLLQCCPPEELKPICEYEPCPAPAPLGEVPQLETTAEALIASE